MKKLYQENYFSRRNWIMENIAARELTAEETVILLMIDFKNEFRLPVSIESLSESTGLEPAETDRTVTELCKKGYLKIVSSSRKISFDISGLFEEHDDVPPKDVFNMFEEEFGRPLSQKETTMIAQWLKKYEEVSVRKALRSAVRYNKLNIDYIDRILVNRSSNEPKE